MPRRSWTPGMSTKRPGSVGQCGDTSSRAQGSMLSRHHSTSESSRRYSQGIRKRAIKLPDSRLAARRRADDILSQYEQMDCLFATHFPETARELSRRSQRRATLLYEEEEIQGASHAEHARASTTIADMSNRAFDDFGGLSSSCPDVFMNVDANSSPAAMLDNTNSLQYFTLSFSEQPAMTLTAAAADDSAMTLDWNSSNALDTLSLFNDLSQFESTIKDTTITDPSGSNTPSTVSSLISERTETPEDSCVDPIFCTSNNGASSLDDDNSTYNHNGDGNDGQPQISTEPLNKARQGLAELENLLQSRTTHQQSILWHKT